MEWIKTEHKTGHSIWHNSAGEQYIVVDGLDINQIHTPGVLESFMTTHYEFFAVAYWLILAITFSFLILYFLVLPLWERHQQGLSLFSDE